MAGFFSPDSKLYRFMCRLTDVVKLNLLWILCSLPIVTAGASTIAASAISLKIADGQEGYIGRDFFKAFRDNLKQGVPMTFITAVCAAAVVLDFRLFSETEENPLLFLITGMIAAYVFAFSLLYVYPLLARYENTVLNSLKNSFRISMKYFLRSLLLLVILAFEAAVMLWSYKTMILFVIAGPAFMNLTVCSFALMIFRELEKIPGTVPDGGASEAAGDDNK
ncbi:MAG: DUF624 domain-containing protein [Prevotella sp.]|nr:DUF624 domain-containing protein [Prevotella sp.]